MDEVGCDSMGTETYEDHVARLTTPMIKLSENIVDNIELLAFSNAFGGEAGELQNIVKKIVKNDVLFSLDSDLPEKFLYEAGDVLWYLTKVIMLMGYSLDEVMQANIDKLDARKLTNDKQKTAQQYSFRTPPFEY